MTIDTLENVFSLVVVIIGSLYSVFKYINTPKREWLYISVFFMTHLLSDYYWTIYTLVMGENPDVSALMAYFGWNVGYIFLILAAIRMRPEDSRSFMNPLIFLPIPLGIAQFLIYLPFGGILNSIWEILCTTVLLGICLQVLIHYIINRKTGARFPWFHMVLFVHIASEIGMWISSCFDWPSPALHPYNYLAFLDCAALLLIGGSAAKQNDNLGLNQKTKTPQERRLTFLLQAATAGIIFFGTFCGYFFGFTMKNSLKDGSVDTQTIALTLFLISVILVVFVLMIIIMTAIRYNAMEGNSLDGNSQRRGRFNFILTIAVTFSLMTVSLLYTSRLFNRVSVAGALEDGQARVKSSSEELENYLAVARSILWVTADTVEIMLQEGESQQNIIDYIYKQTANQSEQFDENFTGLYAYINGEYMDGSGWVPPDDYNVEKRDWYKEAVDANGETIIVSPYVDADTGSVVITICKLLNDGKMPGDYRQRAVVALDMVVNHIQSITEEVNIGGKGYAMVVNQNGLIIAHHDRSYNGQNIIDLYGFDLFDKLIKTDTGTLKVSLGDSPSTLFINSVLDQWYVVIAVSNSQLMAETHNQLLVNLVVSLIIFLLITFFYYLGYKNEQLNAGKMEEMRAASLKQEYEAQVLRQKEAAADVANRAKSNFLAQMSHEIRTPINAVLGMNEMILRKSHDDEILEYAESIDSAGNTLLALINSILDFSKIEDGKMDIIPVNYDTVSFIRDLVNSIIQRADAKGLELRTDIDETLPSMLNGDDVRFTQVIMNLLTNAVKYTERGSVTFSIKNAGRVEDRIRIYVSVRDTGIGIKQDDIDKLSISFERIEEKRNRNIEGTGLGMSIVSSLLDMMGSKICVQSTYGEGSLFYFTIEQGIVDATPIGPFERTPAAGSTGRSGDDLITAPSARVLVVDDNDLNIKVATNLLKLCQINPDTVTSGMDAIRQIEEKTYDIVFLDHMMPMMDGIETLHLMQERSLIPPETRMIVLTANAVVGARENYLKEGFDDYLSKPIELKGLVDILKKYLPASAAEEPDVLEFDPGSDEPMNTGSYDLTKLKDAGVDVDAGILYCAEDIDMYYEMLDFFIESHAEKKNGLNEFLEKKDWHEYRILVHALKGNLKTLGMTELSEKALALEAAADEENAEFIMANHDDLISDYDRLTEAISKAKE